MPKRKTTNSGPKRLEEVQVFCSHCGKFITMKSAMQHAQLWSAAAGRWQVTDVDPADPKRIQRMPEQPPTGQEPHTLIRQQRIAWAKGQFQGESLHKSLSVSKTFDPELHQ